MPLIRFKMVEGGTTIKAITIIKMSKRSIIEFYTTESCTFEKIVRIMRDYSLMIIKVTKSLNK